MKSIISDKCYWSIENNMNDDTSPEQLLTRILRVAKLLTYKETPLHNKVTMDQYIEHDSAPL